METETRELAIREVRFLIPEMIKDIRNLSSKVDELEHLISQNALIDSKEALPSRWSREQNGVPVPYRCSYCDTRGSIEVLQHGSLIHIRCKACGETIANMEK
jgi:hypothetical protein